MTSSRSNSDDTWPCSRAALIRAMVFSACGRFSRQQFVVDPLKQYGVPRSWWNWLAFAKSAGAVGLVVGLFVPVIGIAAAAGLILYFLGAAATTVRERAVPFRAATTEIECTRAGPPSTVRA